MKKIFITFTIFTMLLSSIAFVSCGEDDDETSNKEYDGTLFGEWVENSSNIYVFDYYRFYSDGTGIHGSYEPDIDWINEEDEFRWYTINRKYLYIDGTKYEYSCNGSKLEININGKIKSYYEK